MPKPVKIKLSDRIDQEYAPQGGYKKFTQLLSDLEDKEMTEWQRNAKIGEHFGVTPFTVGRWRKEL